MDIRDKLTNDIIEGLATHYDSENLNIITNAVIKALANYEVTERSTALAVYDDINERLLKRYAACMSVDGKSKKTIALYISRLKAFADFVGMKFTDVGTYDIRFYLASLKERGVSGSTNSSTSEKSFFSPKLFSIPFTENTESPKNSFSPKRAFMVFSALS